MEPHALHTRLAALGIGVAVAAAGIAAAVCTLPGQAQVPEGVEYGYVYSGAKSQSTAFTVAAMGEDSVLLFGSSELSTPASLIPQVPAAVFGGNDYGVQLAYVGEAYDQSLWQAIALGAYAAEDLPNRKVVVIVAPGWFTDGGVDAQTFEARFSYQLYRQFCANKDISEETRAYVQKRLLEQGVDQTTVYAGMRTLPQDVLNDLAFGLVADVSLRSDLREVRAMGTPAASRAATDSAAPAPAAPDFEALRAQALADARAASTTNDWGVEDAFWTGRLAPVLDIAAGSRAAETYSATPEYDDFACFLQVCAETGIEPLVVISPVMGPYYDHIGIDASTRASCYQRIRDIASSLGAQVADFSDREYEQYFLFDIVHFGWTGWVDVEEAIYGFVKGGA